MIETMRDLPGYVLRFVGEHRKKIHRLAIVTSDRLLSAMPHIANHFLVREARQFRAGEDDTALAWLSSQPLARDGTGCTA